MDGVKRFLFMAISLLLVAAACGGSDADESAVEGSTTTSTETTTTDETAVETTTTVETSTTTAETASTEQDDPTEVVPVRLFEWAIDAPIEVGAGTVTFEVVNIGEFPHEFAVARGDSYETLPQLSNGAVDEDALGADWLGRTERVAPEERVTISFDLEPGNYVFLCNIQAGPNSHASQGQVLSVTVVP